jgi:hypothetical protein
MKINTQGLLKEPTLHFLLIALLAFAAYGLLNAGNDKVLEIDPQELEARLFMQELASGQALSPEQRQLLTAAYIEEQLLVQEALAMNLDNDARIHDILAQKMRHVLSAQVIQPDEQTLLDFYEENIERYRRPATLQLDELVLNTREAVSPELQQLLDAGAEPDSILALEAGDVAPLDGVSQVDLANIFSADFAEQLFAADSGQWQGPFVSNRGQHWLRIRQRQPAHTPAGRSILEQLRLDWIAREEEVLLAREIAELMQQYDIVYSQEDSE